MSQHINGKLGVVDPDLVPRFINEIEFFRTIINI